jgi:DNA-binding transcriptional ArsR family regulator
MDSFTPVPFQLVSEPRQLKAFADPLRVRVIHLLNSEALTNQQLADRLGEPQAKVFYHLRFLLDAGLITLVEERVRGGNVEKYYRATARLYGLRPGPDEPPTFAASMLESVLQEVAASEATWPDQPIEWENRRLRLSPPRAREFNRRLLDQLAEFWGGPDPDDPNDVSRARSVKEDPDAPRLCFAAVLFREPSS